MENNIKEEVNQEEKSKGSKTYQDIMRKLDELEIVTDKLVKSSRMRGFIEGSLVTGGLALGFAITTKMLKRT